MDKETRPRDVAALFERSGLRRDGNYREFGSRRSDAAQQVTALPAAPEPANSSAETAQGRLSIFPEHTAPGLDRVLAGAFAPGRPASTRGSATIGLFSLAGGVGKTTLATTLGRVLSGWGRRTVLANYASSFGFQHLLGPRSQNMGDFTFLYPPPGLAVLPLTVIEADPTHQERAWELLEHTRQHAEITLVDFSTSLPSPARKVLEAADDLLIPILPDVHSAATLLPLEAMFRTTLAPTPRIHYLLNRYDATRALHQEMRERLQATLGPRLLPFSLADEPRIQDAMRSGITLPDYAPDAPAVAELHALAKWVEQLHPPSAVAEGATA